MSKTYVRLKVPETVKDKNLEKKLLDKVERRLFEQGVLDLYREGEISTGTGAKMLGLPLYDFIQFLGQHQVSIFNLTEEELAADVAAATAAANAATKARRPKR